MKKIYCFIALLLCVSSSFAQKIDTIEVQRNAKGQISFARISDNDSTGPKIYQAIPFLKQTLRTQSDDEFKSVKEERDNLGFIHQRYQQYYKGIKVEGATYLVHAKEGKIKTINGEYASIQLNSVTPKIESGAAVSKALNTVNAEKYAWNSSQDKAYPKGELVIRKVADGNRDWRLAWKLTVDAISPLSSENIFVDAETGEVIDRVSLICHTNSPATADTRYSGSKSITTDSYSGSYRLREVRNSVNINTLNFNHGNNPNVTSGATDFTDADNSWTSAEYNNANKDNAALDAHWASETVLDYWKNAHGRNSLDGNGLTINNYIHFDYNYDNAFWLSTTNSMYYGDGALFNALTSLDVCAHELGHGICQFTANLEYKGESGALNEGFSDIWGATIEYYGAPAKQRWQIGEDLGITLRYMNNPNIMGQPDTYGGTYWYSTSGCTPNPNTNDNCGVHTNSGVLNYWYYLLVEGGSGTNDISSSFNVFGIGIDDAAKIAYRAEAYYLNSTANFAAARTATLNAAEDLFGATSCQYISVMNAWYAVGVGSAFSGTTITPYIPGPDALCTGSQNYTLNAGGSSYAWSLTGTGASYTPSGNTATLTATGNGTAYLHADVTNACGTTITGNATKKVYIGTPTTPYARAVPRQHPTACGYIIACPLQPGTTMIQQTSDGGVTWVTKNLSYNPLSGMPEAVLSPFIQGPAGPFYITLRYGNTCGFGPSFTSTVRIGQRNCGGGPGGVSIDLIDSLTASGLINASANNNFMIYPNPSFNGQVTVATTGNSTFNKILVYNQVGGMVKTFNYNSGQSKATLILNTLKPGIYHVKVMNGSVSEVKKIVLQ